jgi:hypothetical protein
VGSDDQFKACSLWHGQIDHATEYNWATIVPLDDGDKNFEITRDDRWFKSHGFQSGVRFSLLHTGSAATVTRPR